MAKNFYNLPQPWNPGYAVPDYVLAEPVARGAFVTNQLPRGTISQVPKDLGASYKPAFATPKYVKDEPYGGNAITTMWMPRGTIFGQVAEFGQISAARKILGRNDANLGSLGDDTLGVGVGTTKDPIGRYGKDAASWIMHSIQGVPPDQRQAAMRAVFDALDRGLWARIEAKREELKRGGAAPKAALQAAIATEMSAGMLKELVAVGKRAKRGDRQPVARTGHVALGVYPDAAPRAEQYALEALGWGLSSLNPVNLVTSAASAVASGVSTAVTATGSAIKTAVTATGGAIKDATLATGGFIKGAVNTLGSLACQVVSSPAGQLAAGAAAGPAGAAGSAVMSATICGGGKAGTNQYVAIPPPPPPKRLPSWVMPAALGVGIFGVGALLLRRK